MKYRLEVTPEFEQDLTRLTPQTRRRILSKLEWLAEHFEADDGTVQP